jgi:outer membrane lipopolysaccharide assembly protein LptE/RlpB
MFCSNWIRTALILLMLSQVAGCGGWHMRGSYQLASASDTSLHLNGGSPEFRADLLRAANLSGLTISDNANTANLAINISSDLHRRRIYTVGVNEQPTEFLLIYAVQASAKTAGKSLFDNQEIRRERIIRYDSENPLAGDNEAQLVINELRQELANQILFRAVNLYQKVSQ